MPLLLPEDRIDDWMYEDDKTKVESLIQSVQEPVISAHTVQKLKGKNALGNVPEASQEFIYPELDLDSILD